MFQIRKTSYKYSWFDSSYLVRHQCEWQMKLQYICYFQMVESDLSTVTDLIEYIDKSGGIIIAFFYAEWCAPCLRIAPKVHEFMKDTGINVAKINVDKAGELQEKYQINCMPTYIIMTKDGKSEFSGAGASIKLVSDIFQRAKTFKA